MTTSRLRRLNVSLVLAVSFAAADAAVVHGQSTPVVTQGSRVRITAPYLALRDAIGVVQETTDEDLVVQLEFPRRVATVDRSQVAKLEASTHREGRALRGLGLGLVGGAMGLLIGAMSRSDVWSSALPEDFDLTVLPLVHDGAGVQMALSMHVH